MGRKKRLLIGIVIIMVLLLACFFILLGCFNCVNCKSGSEQKTIGALQHGIQSESESIIINSPSAEFSSNSVIEQIEVTMKPEEDQTDDPDTPGKAVIPTMTSTPIVKAEPNETTVPERTSTPFTPQASFTPRPTNTPTPKPTNTNTPTPRPTNSPTPRPTNTPTPRPTNTPTPKPTNTPTPKPTNTPTPKPTPTKTPTPKPTKTPKPTPTPHVHTWVVIYKTIHHDAEYEYIEHEGYWKTVTEIKEFRVYWVAVTKNGEPYSPSNTESKKVYFHEYTDSNAHANWSSYINSSKANHTYISDGYYNESKEVETKVWVEPWTEKVLVKEPWDEKVPDYRFCNLCGADEDYPW